MSQGRATPAGAGKSNGSALATGANGPSATSAKTEEWDAGPTTLTFDVS